MGSLIKNPGGTLAPGGGYVAGRADLIGAVGARLAAPGIGTDAGGVSGTTMRLLLQGEARVLSWRVARVGMHFRCRVVDGGCANHDRCL
jgi:cystathionine beta-lyase family protein involved in aluminum resistance